jgi:hypothetical protein
VSVCSTRRTIAGVTVSSVSRIEIGRRQAEDHLIAAVIMLPSIGNGLDRAGPILRRIVHDVSRKSGALFGRAAHDGGTEHDNRPLKITVTGSPDDSI